MINTVVLIRLVSSSDALVVSPILNSVNYEGGISIFVVLHVTLFDFVTWAAQSMTMRKEIVGYGFLFALQPRLPERMMVPATLFAEIIRSESPKTCLHLRH